jgi:uncharacterized protein (TIGR02145 family)
MKITLLTLTILFNFQLTAQTQSFVGKWVKTKLEIYQNEKLIDSEYVEINKKCPSYISFGGNGVFEAQDYTDSCMEKRMNSGTYIYKSGLLYMTENGETNEAIIDIKEDKLLMTINEEDAYKVIIYLDKLANVNEKSETYYKVGKVSLKNYRKSNMIDDQVQAIDLEEKSYKTVTIGDQIWMAENLNTSYFQNGDKIYQATTKNDWINANKEKKAAWCYLNFDSNNGSKYGKLYNRYAVNDPRGLAPKGLEIPDPNDWSELVDYVSGEDKGSWVGRDITAKKLMSKAEKWAYNEEGYDKYGFNAKPSGYIRLGKKIGSYEYNECFFSGDKTWGVWWSKGEEEGKRWSFYYVPNKHLANVYKGDGYSVRAFRKK